MTALQGRRLRRAPGVYWEDTRRPPPTTIRTGVPVLIGYTDASAPAPVNRPVAVSAPAEAMRLLGAPTADGFLCKAVRGFFENGGGECYVIRLDDEASAEAALEHGLDTLETVEGADLVCAPDIMRSRQRRVPLSREAVASMQARLTARTAGLTGRFALLDSLPGADAAVVRTQRAPIDAANAALYYPWVRVAAAGALPGPLVPPCGHVAGLFARTDRTVGVHKPPANEVLEGVIDLEAQVDDAQQRDLNPEGVNCLRALPGRGIRLWGARTLSRDPSWTYVSVRRLFLAVARRLQEVMAGTAFEPNGPALWQRLRRELTAYCDTLLRQGALQGGAAADAYFVSCDETNNPDDVRAAGMVVADIGLAPAWSSEFIEVRVVQTADSVGAIESTV